jgi:AcrR family transcriptional regulator
MAEAGDERRRRLEEAALGVFLRWGFRKASMDEVAQAAGVSRQALYLHFATKEALFRAAVGRFFDDGQSAVDAALGEESCALEARLLGAFEAWVGRHVGSHSGNADDLAAAATEHAGELVTAREGAFVESVAQAMRRGGLAAAYRPTRLTARQLAETLYATARGLKQGSTREGFTRAMTVAVRAMCAPLKQEGET